MGNFPENGLNNDWFFRHIPRHRFFPVDNPNPCLEDFTFCRENADPITSPVGDNWVFRHILNCIEGGFTDPCHNPSRDQYWSDSQSPFGPWIDPDGFNWIVVN